jgi:hypothetical protein
VAIQTIRKNGILHDYYTRLTDRGMKRMMALVAVSRKLLGILYAIVRDDSEYSVNFESMKRQCCQQIDLSDFVAHELSAFSVLQKGAFENRR